MERFAIEGYVVTDLVGFGGTGEVWRARESATGETVALKRLRSRGVQASDRLRREAGVLATVAGPHVIGFRRMVVDDDEAVIVMDFAAGGSLASLLATRGRLSAPEMVTVIAPVAAALAAAHGRELIHGDLTPANILFTDDGRPLLADFGVARAMGTATELVEATAEYLDPTVAAGAQPSSASDVFALGAVAFHCLTGHPPWGSGQPDELTKRAASGHRPHLSDVAPDLDARVVTAVEAMLATDPLDRPDARTAANDLLRASPVAPLDLGAGMLTPASVPLAAPATQIVQPQRRPAFFEEDEDESEPWTPWRRRIVLASAAGLALSGAIGVGVSLAGTGHAHVTAAAPRIAPSPRSTPTDWRQVVAHLDELRAAAFSEDDKTSLADVYVPGSAAYEADAHTLDSLADRGLHAQGFNATVESVRVLSSAQSSERLRVVDRLSGYELVDDTGAIVGHGTGRPATAFTMQLTRIDGVWRVSAVSLD